MKYSSGKHALAICDRSGEQVAYKDLVKEPWSGLMVARWNLEPDPRRQKKVPHDAIALKTPRPDTKDDLNYLVTDGDEYVEVTGNFNFTPFIEVT